jgi:hypothetical protein
MSGILFVRSKLDFKTIMLGQEDMVTFLESNWDQLAFLVTVTWANSHHLTGIQLDPQQYSQIMNWFNSQIIKKILTTD